ncbi:MAG: host-nuclease inhibitor Gam family protein [Betaproteobacteria bacterium]|nr:host-nuclease inhibitor Gam family protein [Betaproteobacteria bacterium]
MAKANRLKIQAEAYVPQTIDDCAADIRRIGDLQRQLTVAQAEMNDAIAEITERYQPMLNSIKQMMTPLQAGVQVWCEANRHDLTRGGKVKTANFTTGEVAWRQRPPSVSVRGADVVISALAELGLIRFIRTKQEVNKDAILAEPDAVRGVAGINVITGVEDFVIVPFEVEA